MILLGLAFIYPFAFLLYRLPRPVMLQSPREDPRPGFDVLPVRRTEPHLPGK